MVTDGIALLSLRWMALSPAGAPPENPQKTIDPSFVR
jgi:hypothetical protein